MFGVQLLFCFFVFAKKYPRNMGKSTYFTGQPVYTQVINLLDKAKIKQLSHQTIGSEKYVKRLDGWTHLIIMLFGVLRHYDSLRGLETGMKAEINKLNHLGIDYVVRCSTFAEQGLNKLADVEEAVANFAAQCSRKLREQHTVCNSITVFAHTSRFREDLPQSYIYRTVQLTVPTNDHQELVSVAVKMLRDDWKDGDSYFYKKAGVIVWGISRDNAIQTNLFDTVNREKQAALAKAIDEINRKNGHNKIRIAAQGNEKGWQLKKEYISKQYTTNLDDVIVLKVK